VLQASVNITNIGNKRQTGFFFFATHIFRKIKLLQKDGRGGDTQTFRSDYRFTFAAPHAPGDLSCVLDLVSRQSLTMR